MEALWTTGFWMCFWWHSRVSLPGGAQMFLYASTVRFYACGHPRVQEVMPDGVQAAVARRHMSWGG